LRAKIFVTLLARAISILIPHYLIAQYMWVLV